MTKYKMFKMKDFKNLNFGNSNLFRISIFEFRIFFNSKNLFGSSYAGLGYFGAKRTVLDFFSITLANSLTGPYIIQPA
jgi:hypothetical protein